MAVHLYLGTESSWIAQFLSLNMLTAHQNTLESLSYVMLQMCVVGLVHPITAAAFGGIWVVGRVFYGVGYSKSGPEGRHLGHLLSHCGDVPLSIMVMRMGYTMIVKAHSA